MQKSYPVLDCRASSYFGRTLAPALAAGVGPDIKREVNHAFGETVLDA